MKILVLGSGYVGRALCIAFKSEGHHVTATTRSKEKATALLQVADDVLLWNEKTPSNFLDPFDCLIFCAAADSPSSYKTTYLDNSQKIFEAAETAPHLKQILYTSSTSVYGDHQGKVVTEKSPLLGNTPQAKILIETEENLLSIPRIPVCILRLGEIIGPGRSLKERLMKQGSAPFPGNGTNPVNLSPLEDIVDAVLCALKKELSGIYNCVSDIHITRKELLCQIAREHNLPKPTWDPNFPSFHGGNRIVSSEYDYFK